MLYLPLLFQINGETGESLTYRKMAQEAMHVAVSLTRMGIKKGDVIAIFSENRMEFWSTAIGIFCTGAVVTMINNMYTKGMFLNFVLVINETAGFALCILIYFAYLSIQVLFLINS